MNIVNKPLKTILKVLLLIIICIVAATLLMAFIYSLPLDRILANAESSITVYSENIVKQWAGWTRYSHISNSTDEVMINEAICRPYSTSLTNALLNPHYLSTLKDYFADSSMKIENFGRYWHGYLAYIIPCLLFTNAGGIRMIMLIVQFLLIVTMVIELGKYNKIYSYIFAITVLFINPITTAISFEDADIFIIMMVFSIIILKYNEWLKKNDRYIMLFTLNGIAVAFIDFLTYPLVAWGIPLSIILLINKDNFKNNFFKILFMSIAWVSGYALMWAGKWVVASLFTSENIIADGINQVLFRTVGNSYTFLETLEIIWTSINDIPMLLLYAIAIIALIVYVIKNKLKLNTNKENILNILPQIIISISPFVWYFVVRNHSYVHPWFEYRELAVTVWALLISIYKLFKNV